MFMYISTQEKNHKHLLPLQISNAYTSSQHGRQVKACNAARDTSTNCNVAIPWLWLSHTTFLAFKNCSISCTSQVAEFSIFVFIFNDYSKVKTQKYDILLCNTCVPLDTQKTTDFHRKCRCHMHGHYVCSVLTFWTCLICMCVCVCVDITVW